MGIRSKVTNRLYQVRQLNEDFRVLQQKLRRQSVYVKSTEVYRRRPKHKRAIRFQEGLM